MVSVDHEMRNANENINAMLFFTYQCDKDKSLVKHCFGEGVENKPATYCFVSVI